jgi:hypothetical protein
LGYIKYLGIWDYWAHDVEKVCFLPPILDK